MQQGDGGLLFLSGRRETGEAKKHRYRPALERAKPMHSRRRLRHGNKENQLQGPPSAISRGGGWVAGAESGTINGQSTFHTRPAPVAGRCRAC